MRIIFSLCLCLLFVVGSWSCSLPVGAKFYSITQRTILAPLVIHGTVLNISTPNRLNVLYKACVQVDEVIKGKKNIPKVLCFGEFGPDYLCKTDVYERLAYIFFLNDDFTSRYDGFPPVAAVFANPRTLGIAKRGFCQPYRAPPSSCVLPRIEAGSLSLIKRVKEGHSLIVPCNARSGTTPYVVEWSKRGTGRLSPNFSDSLRILSVTISDMGTYVCTIYNPAGQVSALVRVFVVPEPCGANIALKPFQNTTIQSPKYPQSYPLDKQCSWRICPAPGQRIGLDFKSFKLKFEDSVEIYHECDPNGNDRLKYCFNTSPGKIVSRCTSRCIQFWFLSGSIRNSGATGFLADVSSTDEGTTIYDYGKLYCDHPILIRFIPKEVYYSIIRGEVLFNYKQTGPNKGQQITISISDGTKVGLFGCHKKMETNMEYYVGASRTYSGEYVMKFYMLTDAGNKPPMFDKYLNDYKNTPPACRPTAPPRPPGKPSRR